MFDKNKMMTVIWLKNVSCYQQESKMIKKRKWFLENLKTNPFK